MYREIAKAILKLVAPVEEREERLRSDWLAQDESAALAKQIAREAVRDVLKAGFNPNEPRVPAGNPDGGQWTSGGGGSSSNDRRVLSDATPDNDWIPGAQYAANDPPGIGHNQGPPLEEPPPPIPPETSDESPIWDFVKVAVQWLLKAGVTRLAGVVLGASVADFLAAAGAAYWLNKYAPAILSYFDPPKTWAELQQNRGPGYDRHHVVEQWAKDDGMPRSKIYSPDNVVPIPKLKHWRINGWLGKPNPEFKDSKGDPISPREYLRGKSWEERYRFGLDVLVRFEVLKP